MYIFYLSRKHKKLLEVKFIFRSTKLKFPK